MNRNENQLCELLYNEGLELCREVLRLVIKSSVGRTPEELLYDETVKSKVTVVLPENCHRFLSNLTESQKSVDVLYVLIQLYSKKEPKSGWGNPVKGSDTGIGDDVDRLYRIFNICKEISNPGVITVDDYARL